MRRSTVRSHLPAREPAVHPTKTATLSPDSDLPRIRKPRNSRRIRSPAFPVSVSASGARASKHRAASIRRPSNPATPLLRWKFDDADRSRQPPPEPGGESRRKNARGEEAPLVSARKLAAGIWHLQLPVVSGGRGEGTRARLGFEPKPGHLHIPYACDHNSSDRHTDATREFSRAISAHNPNNGILHKLEASAAVPNPAMERATKWDPGCAKASDEVYRIYGHLKLLEDQQVTSVSIVSSLQTELQLARTRICELEAERLSEKRKHDHLLRKLAEEKASWRTREHTKIRSVIDAMKDDLGRERKNQRRTEIINSKLINELAEAKLSAKRFLQDYEKERKARELMEEVCDELAKEIAEDKAEVEALKSESMKIQDEVEEERRMLQMAEVWREERVQMKLIDAKLMLEEKYSQLSSLQADIEAYMRTRRSTNPCVPEIKEADLLREAAAAGSVNVVEIKEFSYQPPPASDDIFSFFQELQPREETNDREVEQCYGYSPTSRSSKVQISSPDINGFLEKPTKTYAYGSIGRNRHKEGDTGWVSTNHGEEQASNNSPEDSDPSVNGICEESNASVSGTDWEENGDSGQSNSKISEVYSSTTKQSRKKISSIVRLWRSSSRNSTENYKKYSVEAMNGRLSNATLSPADKSGEVGLSSSSVGQWSSPDSLNPHITRGVKGFIERRKGTQKQSLKSKLLEARLESQRIQLRHVLQQKI